MVKSWHEEEPRRPTDGGDVGGDEQIGTAWERRFTLPPREDGLHPVLTLRVYVADEDYLNQDDPGHTPRPVLRQQEERILCRDPKDPGGTGDWADYHHMIIPFGGSTPSDADAYLACAALRVPTTEDWDGLAGYERSIR